MPKVSVGLRGWRFEEDALFTEEGEFRPLEEMDEGVRERVRRLLDLVDSPCDACWLVHGAGGVEECAPAEVVYGEPHAEVVLCEEHERDLVYWYQEAGGSEHRGTADFQDAFYEWFDAGNRAPEEFEGIEHVDTDPFDVPTPSDRDDLRDEQWTVEDRIDLRGPDGASGSDPGDGTGDEATPAGSDDAEEPGAADSDDEGADESAAAPDLDLDRDYPTG